MVVVVFVVIISSTLLKSERFSWFSLTKYLFIGHCITEFCFRIYRAEQRLSCFKLSCNFFGIIPFADSTNGII